MPWQTSGLYGPKTVQTIGDSACLSGLKSKQREQMEAELPSPLGKWEKVLPPLLPPPPCPACAAALWGHKCPCPEHVQPGAHGGYEGAGIPKPHRASPGGASQGHPQGRFLPLLHDVAHALRCVMCHTPLNSPVLYLTLETVQFPQAHVCC